MNNEVKKFLDDYNMSEIIIGEGSFGTVVSAIRKSDRKKIAIKTVERSVDSISSVKEECLILSNLDHPNILKIYDYGKDDDYFYSVMPLYEEDLDTHMDHFPKFPKKLALRVFCQLLDGVEYLHENDIVHRDISLENILISDVETSDIVLIDFEFSTYQKIDGPLLNDFVGTMSYTAPEIFKGIPYEGRFSDIWSIGVVLYIMLTGEFPFWEPKRKDLFVKITEKDFVIKSEWGVSKSCEDLLRSMLEKDPRKRPSIPKIRQILHDEEISEGK